MIILGKLWGMGGGDDSKKKKILNIVVIAIKLPFYELQSRWHFVEYNTKLKCNLDIGSIHDCGTKKECITKKDCKGQLWIFVYFT